ncbi:hypothetical protein BU17DRAFT_71761 [Hysterangium stoloniferum]|nr:hypothetical protein BU17DRAFT_71761 [Hysterangium stoloniferum]
MSAVSLRRKPTAARDSEKWELASFWVVYGARAPCTRFSVQILQSGEHMCLYAYTSVAPPLRIHVGQPRTRKAVLSLVRAGDSGSVATRHVQRLISSRQNYFLRWHVLGVLNFPPTIIKTPISCMFRSIKENGHICDRLRLLASIGYQRAYPNSGPHVVIVAQYLSSEPFLSRDRSENAMKSTPESASIERRHPEKPRPRDNYHKGI